MKLMLLALGASLSLCACISTTSGKRAGSDASALGTPPPAMESVDGAKYKDPGPVSRTRKAFQNFSY